jgi:hypothetical protein
VGLWQVVEHLPCKLEAILLAIPLPHKKEKIALVPFVPPHTSQYQKHAYMCRMILILCLLLIIAENIQILYSV